MGYKKSMIFLSALLLFCLQASGQQGSIEDLRIIFERLKAMKTYSFENHTNAVFPNGQKDAVVTNVFMDKTKQCLFYSNKGETTLLNNKWVYKANHISKTAQVFNLASYNKRNKKILPELQTLFQYDATAMFIDSVVMRYGKLLSTEKKGGFTTYRVGFAPDAAIKQIVIIYDEDRQLPERIYIKTLTESGGRKMQTEIMCNNYKTSVPSHVFDERAFFSTVKGKVILAQYKNYKVYSLL